MCRVVVVGKGDSRTEGDEALARTDREGNDDMESRFSWRERLLVDELPLMPWLLEVLLVLLLSKVLVLAVVEGGRFLRLLMIS